MRLVRISCLLVFLTALSPLLMPVQSALARDGETICSGRIPSCHVIARAPGRHSSNPTQGKTDHSATRPTDPTHVGVRVDQLYRSYKSQRAAWDGCVRAVGLTPGLARGCGKAPTPPLLDGISGLTGNPSGVVTGEVAAAVAAARLDIPVVKPGIGPSPSMNKWRMAAVGYPLWLWGDGQTHVGPVTDTAGGLSVSLDAKVSGVSFRMGDGHVVNCAGTGRRWSRSVQPGEASPTCGYRYTEPSLPKGSYTVAAVTTWSVRWTAGGEAGVITVPAVATTQLPVGELQVLVR